MANMTNYLEKKLLDHTLGGVPYIAPDPLYLALYTSGPTESGNGDEVVAASYARATVTFGTANTDVNDATTSANDVTVTFPEATENWGTITHIAIYDDEAAGNMLFYGDVENPRAIETADVASFGAGTITIEFQ